MKMDTAIGKMSRVKYYALIWMNEPIPEWLRKLKFYYITPKFLVMATNSKNEFANGLWIKNWKFKSNKKPFNSKMTTASISKKMNIINKYLDKHLKDKKSWIEVDGGFHKVNTKPNWEVKPGVSSWEYILTVIINVPGQPPGNTVVAPPPPTQPPPPY
jgi:hypothetical protein